MAKQDIEPYQQNLRYKQAFLDLGLNLTEVFEFNPLDLDLENRRLASLLAFVQKYQNYGSQELMELEEGGYCFPPIFPGISPESDWYRFEQWLQGQPVRKTITEQLPATFIIKDPNEIPELEIEAELKTLIQAVEQAGYGFSLNEGMPARLVYKMIREWIGEEFELCGTGGGGWFFDGCSGYCPGCEQRPWCETGLQACWSEDEEVGKMFLTDELKEYVSASPQSLVILQVHQVEKDAAMAKYMKEHGQTEDEDMDDWKVEQN